MYTEGDIQIFHWSETVRRRPEMYLGNTGYLGLRFLARELFECPLAPRWLSMVAEETKLEIRAASMPVSVEPRKAGDPMYLIEVASRMQLPIDDPPSISGIEIMDVQARPPVFRRIAAAPTAIATANALSSELRIVSYRAGVATEARFVRGTLAASVTNTESGTAEDGLLIALALDREIFKHASFRFEDLAQELRDFALRRRVDVELRDSKSDLIFALKGGG